MAAATKTEGRAAAVEQRQPARAEATSELK